MSVKIYSEIKKKFTFLKIITVKLQFLEPKKCFYYKNKYKRNLNAIKFFKNLGW